ncbi:MAG: fluoride efflux transporter CrcB [Calditrichaeota bacterium]|nr:fluoride efflux transporter CrcB [Calditrichota bacterium]MCB9391149.1 fluoride efflux transporter CrcB [Calditrichota bacterium]
MNLAWIGLFGALGALSRFGLSSWIAPKTHASFPWPTLVVNLLGCLAIGAIMGSGLLDSPRHPHLRLAFVTGFLGSFTTFSAFSAESWLLIESGKLSAAAAYILASLIGGLLLTALGYGVARLGGQ